MRLKQLPIVLGVLVVAMSTLLYASLPASDDFNRADADPIGGNWSTPGGVDGCQVKTNTLGFKSGANYSYCYWNADTPNNDQFAQGTLGGATPGAWYAGTVVRGSTSALTGYFYGDFAGTYKIALLSAGSLTTLQTCSGTPTAGDVIKLSVSGTSLTGTINGGSTCTATDATLTSGSAGAFGYGSAALGVISLDDWSADNVGGGGGGGSTPARFPCNTLHVGCH